MVLDVTYADDCATRLESIIKQLGVQKGKLPIWILCLIDSRQMCVLLNDKYGFDNPDVVGFMTAVEKNARDLTCTRY